MIAEWRKEFVQQVPVRRVELGDLEAEGGRTFGRGAKRIEDARNPRVIKLTRRRIGVTERNRAGGLDVVPAALVATGRSVAVPGTRRAALPAGVRKLDASPRALPAHKS